jgi:hypothetical protein
MLSSNKWDVFPLSGSGHTLLLSARFEDEDDDEDD